MLQKILILVILSVGAVLSIYDPHHAVKTKSYQRDPRIAHALEEHQQRLASYVRNPARLTATKYHPRLSESRYQQRDSVSQRERHANYGRPNQDFANNIDELYGGCPSGFTGQLPYPYDCRRFINCWKGRAFIQTCGPGTVFNGDTFECDSPNKVVCQELGGLPKKKPEPGHHRLGRIQTTVADDVSCPPGFTGLLPHPLDCSKFLNCASGTMHIQTCGPQTMFSPQLKVCDFAHKVDCSGRGSGATVGSSTSTSTSSLPATGNRGGKTFETSGGYQPNSFRPPQRKGWSHHHNHHGFHQRFPTHQIPGRSYTHSRQNCTDPHNHHQHHQQSPARTPPNPPIFHRDRWSNMNRTRPPAPVNRTSSWQSTATNTASSQQPPSWRPVTITTPQPTWQTYSGSGGQGPTTTVHAQSKYPNINYDNSPNHTDTSTTTTTTTIYYAQPVDDNIPSEEVFSNVYGGDVSEVSLPTNRRNASRGVIYPSLQPEPIPFPPPSSDDRQFQIPDQNFDFSSPQPSYTPSYSLRTPSPRPGISNRPSPHVEDQMPATEQHHSPMDAISIPSQNLMPPYPSPPGDDRQPKTPNYSSPRPSYTPSYSFRPSFVNRTTVQMSRVSPPQNPNLDQGRVYPSFSDDDRQFQISDQESDFSSPYPSYTVPQPAGSRPSQYNPGFSSSNRTRVYVSSSPGDSQTTVDAINIPSTKLMPPHRDFPDHTPVNADDSQSEPSDSYPNYSPPYPWPSITNPRPNPPSSRSYNTTTIFLITTTPAPDQQPPIYDESNLFGGMLPPLPSDPESIQPSDLPTPSTKTSVHTFQIYPPPAVQNGTARTHPTPSYSHSYSGVALSHRASAPRKATPSSTSRTHVSEGNFEPEIIFSHDVGVVIPKEHNNQMRPTTTQHHGVSPPDYNREFYKQTTPSSVYHAPAEIDTSDEVGQLPISEAIRLLLRPYFNRSGTVTDEMAAKAESHIMNLSRANEPSPTSTSTSTSTSTTTTTTTTTSTPVPAFHKDVEIIFAGEQNSLIPGYGPPIHSSTHVHTQSTHLHSRDYHRKHPHLPNPFANDFGAVDSSKQEATTRRTYEAEATTTTELVGDPSVDDVCEFDCGNGKCIKTFETCDGVNHCDNRKDEENCDHLGYEIRLSGEGSGRVEVKILGQWGYVCDDKFGIQDANVVCRELGFPLGASEVHGNSYYPPPAGEEIAFIMDEVDCIGNETSIKDCRFMGWGVSDCAPDEVAGVQCKTPVMKCPNDFWLCRTSEECIPPAFVCDNVPDCSDKSDESNAVCNSTVEYRLKGGRSKTEGRLEILYRGVWGTICDDDFGQIEAQVACNSLGFNGPAKIVKNAFGPGSGPIWLDQISCYGNESTIDACNHWSWGEHNCNHTEDVSLKCSSEPAPTAKPTRRINTGIKGASPPTDDVQTTIPDDIGIDLYPMERSSKLRNNRRICGHFNANLTEQIPDELERVVQGNVAKRGHHPWQATIRTKGLSGASSHWCGAVLISKKHLLTAAHCLIGYPKGAYFIRLGDHYANIAESSEIDSYIENWYIHEKFRETTRMNNDIALIVMKNPVRFNDYIQPICLPAEGSTYNEGRLCTISGWGSIHSGVSTPSNNLRMAHIPVISDAICKLPHVYGKSITEGMFCAGYMEESVDACEGDSGGPLVCSDSDAETLYGIISWGQQCGYANKPGVYVRIEKYLDWIYEKIRFSMQQTN